MTTILLVDDHQVVLDGLLAILKGSPAFRVIGTAKNGWEAIQFIEEVSNPDIIIMDITMPELDGPATLEKMKEMKLESKVIMLSMHLSAAYAKDLLSKGAKGYLEKDCSREQLFLALKDVQAGGTYLSPKITDLLVTQGNNTSNHTATGSMPRISKREKEILELIHKEHRSKEIAEILGISFNTVETHRKHLLNKFAVSSTVGLIREAMRSGMLE